MEKNTLAVVHAFLRRSVAPGAVCIDATAGRGRDTALLCRLAGPTGRVLAFDIQPEAVEDTRRLLAREGLSAQVILDSHANMERYAEAESVDAIVFNFGRLPGGDPQIFTRADTSLAAVDAGLRLLRPGGVMALAVYYGGENGYDERDALLAHLRQLDSRSCSVLVCDWANRPHDPPIPVLIWKER
jgi:SAM-dependent methyltransferase